MSRGNRSRYERVAETSIHGEEGARAAFSSNHELEDAESHEEEGEVGDRVPLSRNADTLQSSGRRRNLVYHI
jgi:hypothetical protein